LPFFFYDFCFLTSFKEGSGEAFEADEDSSNDGGDEAICEFVC